MNIRKFQTVTLSDYFISSTLPEKARTVLRPVAAVGD